MLSGKNANWNVQNAKPPANSVTEVTPEKELKPNIKSEKNNNNSSSPPPNTTTARNRKKKDGNKVIDFKIEDDAAKCNGNGGTVEDYSAIEDENHPDFGINGFLNAERFTNGELLSLFNNNIQETKMVPQNLELCQPFGGQSVTDLSDGIRRSGSSTTITTSSTGDGPTSNRMMRFAVNESDFVDEDEESGKKRERGGNVNGEEEMDFVSTDNPVFEPYNVSELCNALGVTHQPTLRSQSQFAPYFNQSLDRGTNIFGGGKENEQIEGGKLTTNSTIGTNTISTIGANNGGGGRILYSQGNGGGGLVENNNTNPAMLPYQILMQPSNRQQQIDREQNYQKVEQRRNMQKKKQLSKEKGQIIKPQDQPGYFGDKDFGDILKMFGQEPDRSQKSNSPSATRNVGMDSANGGKKLGKKQKQKQQRISQNGKKRQQKFAAGEGGGHQESYASPEEEEMDVDIELDNGSDDSNLVGGEQKMALMNGGMGQQRRDRGPIAIEMIVDGIWEKPIGEEEIKTVMVENNEDKAKEKASMATFGGDDKWESAVVKKTLKAQEEQKRKLEEELAKKKAGEEDEKLRKKKAAAEEEERKKKRAQQEQEEKERKKAESEERKKRQKEEQRKRREEEQRKRMQAEEEKKKKKAKEAEEKERLKKLEEEKQRKEAEEKKAEQSEKKDEEESMEQEQPKGEEEGGKEKKQQTGKKEGGKKAWISKSLVTKKQNLPNELKIIKQTPLLDRIPANVLAELRAKCGWKNPFTIVSPYCTVDCKSMAESKKAPEIGEEEREAIWNGPADKWLEQKPRLMPTEAEKKAQTAPTTTTKTMAKVVADGKKK